MGATAGRADGLTGELLWDFVSMAMSEIKGETFTCLAGGKKTQKKEKQKRKTAKKKKNNKKKKKKKNNNKNANVYSLSAKLVAQRITDQFRN